MNGFTKFNSNVISVKDATCSGHPTSTEDENVQLVSETAEPMKLLT
jgi:hypothetical protein